MWEWLATPFVDGRAHLISEQQMWHARIMFVAWGVLSPLAVIVARFFKVLPWQNWPDELDNKLWWRCHWLGQSLVLCLTVVGSLLMFSATDRPLHIHGWLGYSVLGIVSAQVLLGYFRGSKGGPGDLNTDGTPRGDHYDMTRRRRWFELTHKSLGYLLLLLSGATVVVGMWLVNAPRWMFLSIAFWWTGLAILFVLLQRRGRAIDTYQAIWGPEPQHPGNSKQSPGWGMRRADGQGRFTS